MEYPLKQSVLEGESIYNLDFNFFSLFKDVVRMNQEKTAILYEENDSIQKYITFKIMDEISSRIANIFQRSYNINDMKNKIIAVALKPSEYLPIILLAVMKSGMSYLPIDIEFPEDRIKYILKDAQPAMCIVEETNDVFVYNNMLIFTKRQLILDSENESELITIDCDDSKNALILYTSGSTGIPKGVKLQYSALMNRLIWQWKTLPYNKDEEYCIFKTALTFVDSVCEIWGPILQGRTLIVIPKDVTKNPEKFSTILNSYKIQRIVLVPSLLKSLLMFLQLEQHKEYLNMLKLWICSGETLSVYLVQEFFNWFTGKNKTIANFYGSTEVMGDITFYLITDNDPYIYKNKIPIGKPIYNNIVYIVNKNMDLLCHGEVGELLVAGSNLANGYIHDNKTGKFINNPFTTNKMYSTIFRTGDFAKIENKQLIYEGRQDTQVKIRGHRVDLLEIEKAVLNLLFVENAVVLSNKTEESEPSILCFLVLKENELNIEAKEVQSLLKKILLPYMIPQVIIIDKIPLLVNGKIDRQKLLDCNKISQNINEQGFDYSEIPIDKLKMSNVLFTTINSVLGLRNKKYLNVHSNFYELGGNSLNSVYTVLKLREKGMNISITDFITAKSMKDILDKLNIENFDKIIDDDTNINQNVLEMLNDTHKKDVIEMITESFFSKADLERWLIPDIKKEDYSELLLEIWDALIEKNFSFILKSSINNKVLCVALNFDARDEPEIFIKSKLTIIFDFLEYLEQPIRENQLPKGKNKIFHTFMMATKSDLNSAENVMLMKQMEIMCLKIAKNNNFVGILTTNTSPLTQQLGTDIFKYEVLLDYQVNQYITSDGFRPFRKANNDQRAIVSWKKIDY